MSSSFYTVSNAKKKEFEFIFLFADIINRLYKSKSITQQDLLLITIRKLTYRIKIFQNKRSTKR